LTSVSGCDYSWTAKLFLSVASVNLLEIQTAIRYAHVRGVQFSQKHEFQLIRNALSAAAAAAAAVFALLRSYQASVFIDQ
jgi:hypothetical protein